VAKSTKAKHRGRLGVAKMDEVIRLESTRAVTSRAAFPHATELRHLDVKDVVWAGRVADDSADSYVSEDDATDSDGSSAASLEDGNSEE
jgi:hypothetical protein